MSFRILHTADWHLAARMGQRLTSTGINQREADVARTFTALIDHAIALQPDVFVAAGDLFDRVNPGNPAIIHAYGQLARLRAALPHCIVILIAGNHEAPKTSGAGCVLPLFVNLGIHVVDRSAPRLRFGDLSVLCVPDLPGLTRPPLVPDATAKYNVLLLHGEMQGMPRKGGDRSHEIATDDAHLAEWSYIALGHYHVMHAIAPNCYYSGSIDFCSSDPWGELATGIPKGFIVRDLATGAHEFHPLPVSRRYLDLPRLNGAGLGAKDLDTLLAETIEAADITDAVVRLVVENVDRDVQRALDPRQIRRWKAQALSFALDCRRPVSATRDPIARSYAELRSRPLKDILAERLTKREVPGDVDRDALSVLALQYLERAADVAPAPITEAAA